MSDIKQTRILSAARAVFLRYGYRRANMNDIAEAAGMSRPALYLRFKNKEEIFSGVVADWIDETIDEVDSAIAAAPSPEARIIGAFEAWAERPFALALTSPEASELIECRFDFAQHLLAQAYQRFEASIAPVLASLDSGGTGPGHLSPAEAAHVLASAVRGFKQSATTSDALRRLIAELLTLTYRRQFPTN